jgi:cyclohexadieny/prephenate dehydrogenase
MTVIFNKVALIGLGLIASSIARRVLQDGLAKEVAGYARTKDTRDIARNINLCTVYETLEDTVNDADLVILCVPVGVMGRVAKEIAPFLKSGAYVSDVGSVKRAVIEAVKPELPDHAIFVPAHPLAGTEHSGPESGFAELFDGRWCLLTPEENTDTKAVEDVINFWTALGSNVDTMDADHHDLVLSVTSHVPHLIAYTMVGVADDLQRITSKEVINYSAAGFRDFTRIAASDPTMWRDVFLNNKEATLEILGRFTEELFDLQRAIRQGDGDQLFDYFTRTRSVRRGILDAGQDTAEPNFGRGSVKED